MLSDNWNVWFENCKIGQGLVWKHLCADDDDIELFLGAKSALNFHTLGSLSRLSISYVEKKGPKAKLCKTCFVK